MSNNTTTTNTDSSGVPGFIVEAEDVPQKKRLRTKDGDDDPNRNEKPTMSIATMEAMLGSARDFIIQVLGDNACTTKCEEERMNPSRLWRSGARDDCDGCQCRKEKWERLSEHWKNDFEVALAALHKDCCEPIRLLDITDSLRNNKEFLLKAIAKRSDLWSELPPSFENDMSFVHVITEFNSQNLVQRIMERFPEARSDRNLWEKIIDCDASSRRHQLLDVIYIFETFASVNIRSDPDLMFKACRIHRGCFDRVVHPSLFEQRDFVQRIIRSDEFLRPLQHIPLDAQARWPDLVIESFGRTNRYFFDSDGYSRSIHSVAPSLWMDGNQVKHGWFRAGCPFIKDNFPEEWREDRELFLLVAEHCQKPLDSFEAMSTCLLGSKQFLLQLVELNPRALRAAPARLQLDFDVLTTAVANKDRYRPFGSYSDLERELVLDRHEDGEMAEAFFDNMRRKIRDKLVAHSTLMKLILPAIKFGGGTSSDLSLLNQGSETSKAYMKSIANYVGVPCGKKLRLLRQALSNLPSPMDIEEDDSEDESDGDY